MEDICDDILKSPFDTRVYRYFRLKSNDMKVLLIHDATAKKAAASMNVNVGYWCDPADGEGVAHFCEHMLFMGTKKYPDENHFGNFLAERGGVSNAYTTSENTNYYYDISAEHFDHSLDIFSRFFIDPLMSETATDREVLAVDSEYKNGIDSDAWKYSQLRQKAGDPNHPNYKFGTGSKETLDSPNTREYLLAFHKKYYQASKMSLCVLTNESIEHASKLVVQLFSEVENREYHENYIQFEDENKTRLIPPAYGPTNMMKHYKFVPKQDNRILRLVWPIPSQHKLYRKRSSYFISHLVGHEGEGSLFALLQRKSWTTELIGGVLNETTDFDIFGVNLSLTIAGQQNIDEIISIVYSYIHFVAQSGYPKWLYEEQAKAIEVDFLFTDPGVPIKQVSNLSLQMSDSCPVEVRHLLKANYICDGYDAEHIDSLMKYLVPSNMIIFESCKTFAGKTDKFEKFYQTDYSVNDIPEDTLKRWENAPLLPEIHLPAENHFIPTNFGVVGEKFTIAPALPRLIRSDNQVQLWFKQDDTFLKPKANVIIQLFTTATNSSPLAIILAELFQRIVKEEMNEITYAAQLAGMMFLVETPNDGINICVSGYTCSLAKLVEIVFENLARYKFSKDNEAQVVVFEYQKEKLLRRYQNFAMSPPYKVAQLAQQAALLSRFTIDQRLAVFDEVTPENFESYVEHIFDEFRVTCLVHGNYTEENAHAIINRSLSHFPHNKGIPDADNIPFTRTVQLPENCCVFGHLENQDKQSANSAIFYHFAICGNMEEPNAIMTKLLGHMLAEPAFDELRTKQQLGYIVWVTVDVLYGRLGISVIVQSPSHNPDFIQGQILEFLKSYLLQIEEMSEEKFAEQVKGVIAMKEEKDRELVNETNRYWAEIMDRSYTFDRKRHDVAQLKSITKQQLIDFMKRFFFSNFRCIIMKVYPNGKLSEQELEWPQERITLTGMPEIAAWKSEQTSFDAPAFRTTQE